jgi:hypothetical protein
VTPGATRREMTIAIAAVSAVVGFLVWFHAAVVVEWCRSRSLGSSGVPAIGVVVDNESLTGPRVDGHRVTYRYAVPGSDGSETSYIATRDVDRATSDALSIGSEVEVRYDREDPARSDLARNDRLATMLFIVGAIDLLLMVAAARVVKVARAETASPGSGPGPGESEWS